MTQTATPTPLDRIMRAFRSLVRAEDPNRTYGFGPWEYQVQIATATTFDGSPTEQNFPLPPLVGVPYRPSLAGSSCVPEPGTLAYVAFVNADPSKPILVAFGQTLPLSADVDAAATGTVTVGATAASVNAGGVGAVPLATAGNLAAWGAAVVTAFAGLTITVPPLTSVATTKLVGR